MKAILEARDISMHFGGLKAVDTVDFVVEQDAIASLIGPNGAGKTTFFNMGTGLHTARVTREEREASASAMALLEYVGLAAQAHEFAKNLSYGLQRRLEIARALATQPKLLLLDEPTAGMNPHETHDMTMFIPRLPDEPGLTLPLLDHSM